MEMKRTGTFTKPFYPERKTDPCKNGGTASPDANSLSYKCERSSGFEGEHCTERSPALLNGSLILLGVPQYHERTLGQWIPGRTWETCWRAPEDGWDVSTFHSNCDDKVPTVTIVRVGDYVFGGLANASWAGSWSYQSAPGSFLFSLRNKENLLPFKAPLKDENDGYAIYTSMTCGPAFGKGNHDFYIADYAVWNTESRTHFNVCYLAPSGVKNATTILAGSKNFKPSEIEVFYQVD